MAHWFSVSVLHLEEYRTGKEKGRKKEVKTTSSRNVNKENNEDTGREDGRRRRCVNVMKKKEKKLGG